MSPSAKLLFLLLIQGAAKSFLEGRMRIFYGPQFTSGHMFIAATPALNACGQTTISNTEFMGEKFVHCLKADKCFVFLTEICWLCIHNSDEHILISPLLCIF